MFWEWENEEEDVNLGVDERIREVFSLFHLMTVNYATLYLIKIFSGKHSSVSPPKSTNIFTCIFPIFYSPHFKRAARRTDQRVN